MKKNQSRSKFNDPLIVPRVKNYLAENVDKTFVDVSQMARSLKERYREYSNRNESAFCQMVEAAYKVVLQSYGIDGASSSEGYEEESDLELLDDPNHQVLNEQLLTMYKMQEKKSHSKKERSLEKASELIDISSDEESNPGKAAKLPKLNDQITITPHIPENMHHIKNPAQINTGVINDNTLKGMMKSNDRKRKTDPLKVSNHKQKQDSHANVHKVRNVNFEDIGGISEILSQVCDLILHMKHPEVYKQLGVKAPRGALLHGPPGTGKTLLANAISGKLNLPMISVAGTEMVGGVSGESEERIRELFERAATAAPCILFIDEIDAICGNRLNAQKDMERRIVIQLISSIDSLSDKSESVLVLAATNNPDSLDPALRRAGRLEQEIALGIPSLNSRKEILEILCRNISLSPDVNFETLAQLTPGFVGADLQALLNKACTIAIKRVFKSLKMKSKPDIKNADVEEVENREHEVTNDLPNGDVKSKVDSPAEDAPALIEASELTSNVEQTETLTSSPQEEANKDTLTHNGEVTVTNENNLSTDEITNETNTVAKTEEVKVEVVVITKNPMAEILSYLDETEPYTDEQLSGMTLEHSDFMESLKTTKPCAIREGIVTVPDITWADIGSLKNVREELQLAVLAPVKYPEQLKVLGLTIPNGVLLCGPPGCGKTLLAKAVANEAGINFISVKGPELLNMYVGESERAVRTCFQRARNSAPCVIFFDEFDSLCPKRSQGDSSGATRVVNQLLTEMDGIESREGVFILAATNRPDIIDPAVLRPGRLDRIIYVGLPQMQDRLDILRTITKKGKKPPLCDNIDLEAVATVTEGYSGADLAGLVRLAATQALTQYISEGAISEDSSLIVTPEHFQKAVIKSKPSISVKEQQHYEKLRLKYSMQAEEKCDIEMDTVSANEESMDTV